VTHQRKPTCIGEKPFHLVVGYVSEGGVWQKLFLTRIALRIVQLTSSNTFLRSCIGRAKCCLVKCRLLHDVNQLCMHMEHFQGFCSPFAISALLTSQCALAGWLEIQSVGYNFVNPLLCTKQSKVLKHFTFICAGSIVYSLWLWSCIFLPTTSSAILSLSLTVPPHLVALMLFWNK
jgi:hypothetical protein